MEHAKANGPNLNGCCLIHTKGEVAGEVVIRRLCGPRSRTRPPSRTRTRPRLRRPSRPTRHNYRSIYIISPCTCTHTRTHTLRAAALLQAGRLPTGRSAIAPVPGKKINRSHTNTPSDREQHPPTENNTPDTDTHTHTTRTTPQTPKRTPLTHT